DPETALAMAHASEARWQKGEPQGLLDGMPVALKDTVLTKGWPRLLGSRTIDPKQAWEEDSPATARLRGEGAVFFGKTTTPEFGWKGVTDSPLTGVTRNPWDLERTPGGSSGAERVRVRASTLPPARRPGRGGPDPLPRLVLRHCRAQADLRPGGGLSALGIRRCRACRPDGAQCRRRGVDARCDERA